MEINQMKSPELPCIAKISIHDVWKHFFCFFQISLVLGTFEMHPFINSMKLGAGAL